MSYNNKESIADYKLFPEYYDYDVNKKRLNKLWCQFSQVIVYGIITNANIAITYLFMHCSCALYNVS